MGQYGIDFTEEEVHMLQQSQIPEEDIEEDFDGDVPIAKDIQKGGGQLGSAKSTTMDLIVTFGPMEDMEAITKQMHNEQFNNFDELKETLRKEFEIEDMSQFMIKFVNMDGQLLELSGDNWAQIQEMSQLNQIQLAIELLEDKDEDEDYDKSDFEDAEPQVTFEDPVKFSEISQVFEEIRLILQIKKVKKEDTLRFMLHGIREDGKKVKKISIEMLKDCFFSKLGLSDEPSEKLAKFLIEKPNQQGKIEIKENHEAETKISRKEL